jgi:hypothetical protein
MKLAYFKYLVFALAIATTLLSGCGDKEENPPTLTIDASTTPNGSTLTLTGGEAQPIKIKFSATKGTKDLKSFKLGVSYDGRAATSIVTRTIKGGTFNFDTTIYTGKTPGEEAYVITIEDEGGKTASRTLTYKVKEEGTVEPIKPNSFSATFNNTNVALNSDNGRVYDKTTGQPFGNEIDLTYLWTDAANDNLISPDHRASPTFQAVTIGGKTVDARLTWAKVRTVIRSTSLSPTQFDALKNQDQAELKKVFDAGMNVELIENPSGSRASFKSGTLGNNKVFAFSSKGKYGVLLINSLAEDKMNNNATISVLRQR